MSNPEEVKPEKPHRSILDSYLKELTIPGIKNAREKIPEPDEEETSDDITGDDFISSNYVPNALLQKELDKYPKYQWLYVDLNSYQMDFWINIFTVQFKIDEETLYKYATPPNILLFVTNEEDDDTFFLKYDGDAKTVTKEELNMFPE